MRGHLPLSIALVIHLQRAHTERILPWHLHVDEAGEYRDLAVNLDLHVAESERLIVRRPFGGGGDILFASLRLASGMRVLKIFGHEALQSGGVLLDSGGSPAVG